MRHYELAVVLSPMMNQDQSGEAWGRIKEFITNRQGNITYDERWGIRRLAYPIRSGSHRFLEGVYYLARFEAEKPFNKELEGSLHIDENVLRYMVVAVEATTPLPRRAAPPPPRVEAAAPAAIVAEQPAEGTPAPVADAAPEMTGAPEAAGAAEPQS